VADSTFPATRFKVYKTTLDLSIHNYLIPILTFGAWKLDLYIAASLCKFGWVEKCRKRLHTQHIANGFLESGGQRVLNDLQRAMLSRRRTIWLLPSPISKLSLFSVILCFADFAY
jgi:hypothetical protein